MTVLTGTFAILDWDFSDLVDCDICEKKKHVRVEANGNLLTEKNERGGRRSHKRDRQIFRPDMCVSTGQVLLVLQGSVWHLLAHGKQQIAAVWRRASS